jgi:hypothetical protein
MQKEASRAPENHPCHHTMKLKSRLGGLIKALDHYERGSERAFQ